MGLGLKLLIPDNPFFHPGFEGYSLCDNKLTFYPNYQIFGQLRDLVAGTFLDPGELDVTPTIPTHPLPPGWKVCLSEAQAEDEAEKTDVDGNGDPLTFAYARDLKHLVIPDDTRAINRAVKAFLMELDDNFILFLYWY